MTNAVMEMVLTQQKTVFDRAFKVWQRALSVPRVLKQAQENQVFTTPREVVYEEGTLRLLQYRRRSRPLWAEPLVFCPSLINRPYVLDLQPDRSVVGQMLACGFDVYMIDWGAARAADRNMRLNDYVCGLIKNAGDFVLKCARMPRFHLLGYCWGGTMSTIFTAVYPEMVKDLILLAAPVDFSKDQSLLKVWTDEKYFDVDSLIGTFGNCPATLLQSWFTMMRPFQNLSEKYAEFIDKMHDERFVESFLALEKWAKAVVPVAGETFREFVKLLYQRNQLVKGEFKLGGIPVRLDRITCPVLLLAATRDRLVTPLATQGLVPHIASRDVNILMLESGHAGLAVSPAAHRTFWPDASQWIADHSTPRTGI
jgi:polyhydroxyalkanoate synthase subunit PhaC